MKRIRFAMLVILMSITASAFAQSETKAAAPKSAPPKSEGEKSFDLMKALAGSWEGKMTSVPKYAEIEGSPTKVTLRVTSMGNALMHEMTTARRPDDPITMIYLDNDQLSLTHFCDAGNRPRMTGKISADGKTAEFQFVDVAGSNQYGHMHGAVFTFIDADHHSEDWMYMQPGDKMVHAHVDLQRVK
jgi:hypothetical protein